MRFLLSQHPYFVCVCVLIASSDLMNLIPGDSFLDYIFLCSCVCMARINNFSNPPVLVITMISTQLYIVIIDNFDNNNIVFAISFHKQDCTKFVGLV